MSVHQVTRQGSGRNFLPTLPARHSLSLSFLVCTPDPRQFPPVSLRGPVAGPRPTGLTGHADSLRSIIYIIGVKNIINGLIHLYKLDAEDLVLHKQLTNFDK